jgi:hypothetical protein
VRRPQGTASSAQTRCTPAIAVRSLCARGRHWSAPEEPIGQLGHRLRVGSSMPPHRSRSADGPTPDECRCDLRRRRASQPENTGLYERLALPAHAPDVRSDVVRHELCGTTTGYSSLVVHWNALSYDCPAAVPISIPPRRWRSADVPTPMSAVAIYAEDRPRNPKTRGYTSAWRWRRMPQTSGVTSYVVSCATSSERIVRL